eukprot:TRINITY_DN10628_c0_g1_i1.p1 TRINITY_DN10628_c0_g1~~TRINITY_DN10628_c0_g1_i1.p1  ORF type:complete len:590 (+),score=245.02 TRINITY_DN10628_c0_g1_i1:27-1796(+)
MAAISPELQHLVDQWLSHDPNAVTKSEIQALVAEGNAEELQARLGSRIGFGTAGLRGTMKAGYAFMNDLTVIQASQGLAKLLVSMYEEPTIVVGRDGRHNSERFAQLSAATFVKAGIKVYFLKGLSATPIVAFAVKELNLKAGVMVTASHNPKNDNGYKVYWEAGSQIVSPIDRNIQKSIEENLTPWDISHELANLESLVIDPLQQVSDRYYQLVREKCSFTSETNKESKLKIVYTAMHGVGKKWAERVFDEFNLNPFIPVVEQIEADPEFPTVEFPNPEEGQGSLKLAIDTAEREEAPLIIANDPDADRFAAAEKQKSGIWKIFTGNELGILFADWTWSNYKRLHPDAQPDKCLVINTTVSSKMLKGLADKEGLRYEETLTGFKWMGNLALKRINEGYTFLYSFEDAIGFMMFDVCLDKDGVRAAGAFAELANSLYAKGLNVNQHLDSLYEKYGYYATQNRYFFCYDPKKMERIFDRIRKLENGSYPTSVGGFAIKSVRDLTTGFDSSQPDQKAILPTSSSTQMITFFFENGAVVTLRGSGTEPKLKYYTELNGNDRIIVDGTLTAVKESVIVELLQPVENGLLPPED